MRIVFPCLAVFPWFAILVWVFLSRELWGIFKYTQLWMIDGNLRDDQGINKLHGFPCQEFLALTCFNWTDAMQSAFGNSRGRRHCRRYIMSYRTLYGGFLEWWYPQIIHFSKPFIYHSLYNRCTSMTQETLIVVDLPRVVWLKSPKICCGRKGTEYQSMSRKMLWSRLGSVPLKIPRP